MSARGITFIEENPSGAMSLIKQAAQRVRASLKTLLGVYTAYESIRDLAGDIRFESKLGEGTTVRITLPLNQLS